MTEDISTIPALASVRTQHPQLFAHAEQLVPFCEKHLEGLTQDTVALSGEIVREGKWQDFWSKAGLPVGLLLQELGKRGTVSLSNRRMLSRRGSNERLLKGKGRGEY